MSIITRGYGSNNLVTQGYGGYLQVVAKIVFGGGGSYYDNYQKLDKKEKEKFITLTCIIGDKKIIQTKKKPNKKQKITIKNIDLIIDDILKEINISIDDLKKYK